MKRDSTLVLLVLNEIDGFDWFGMTTVGYCKVVAVDGGSTDGVESFTENLFDQIRGGVWHLEWLQKQWIPNV